MVDLGGTLDNLGQQLEGLSFPAGKAEVAASAEDNGASQEVVDQIKNSSKDTFNSVDEVKQELQSNQ